MSPAPPPPPRDDAAARERERLARPYLDRLTPEDEADDYLALLIAAARPACHER